MTYGILPNGKQQFIDSNGKPLASGQVYYYIPSTTTFKNTYQNSAGTVLNTNPVVLDANGQCIAYGTGSYRQQVYDVYGNLVWDVQVDSPLTSGNQTYDIEEQTFTATSGQTVFTLTTMSYVPGTNNLVVFVDGLKQIVGVNYTETSATVVTFTTGLHVGAVVDFTTAVLQTNANIVPATDVTYNEGGTGAVTTTVQAKLQQTVSVKDFGAVGDGTTDDTAAIQAALNSGYPVYVPAGTYIINGTLTGATNLTLKGQSLASVTFKKTGSGDLFDFLSATTKSNIFISGITFNVNNVGTGIQAQYVNNFTVSECAFNNIQTWGISIGTITGSESTIRNNNILIEKCNFYNSSSTYEQILLFNTEYATVRDCSFSTGTSAIGIGLYQNLSDVLIQRCEFNIHIGSYYSLSTNNITYDECLFTGCDTGIQGANQSDHGAFSYSFVKNLIISKTRFTAQVGTPLQLGAVYGAVVDTCVFDSNAQYGLLINGGNSPVSQIPYNWIVRGSIFANNNTSSVSSTLAPGIRLDAIGSSGGYQNGLISSCVFYDDNGTPKQLYPIVFNGSATWSNIKISSSVLNAYSGAYSVGLTGSAALGVGVVITPDCQQVTTTLPSNLGCLSYSSGFAQEYVSITEAAGSGVSINAESGNWFNVLVNDTTAFSVSAPTNPTVGQRITITINNASGGALGTITWNAVFKLAAWTSPANTYSRSIDFAWNGGNWIEVGRTTVDVPR